LISDVASRLKPQHPLAPPDHESDDAKAQDEKNPRFRPHPCGKRFRARNHTVNAAAKTIAARRQWLFVLPGKDQRFFGRRRDCCVIGLNHRKTAIIDIVGSNRGRRARKQSGRQRGEADYRVPHHRLPIRFWRGPVNAAGRSGKLL
jgi:hypothetical protein